MDSGNAGELVALALKRAGVSHLFTLNGGHIWPILMGAEEHGIRLIDVRHEQSAAFAAEGWAKVTRECGVAAVTAGPGVTNSASALAQAQGNDSPLLVVGGSADVEPVLAQREADHRTSGVEETVDELRHVELLAGLDEGPRVGVDEVDARIHEPAQERLLRERADATSLELDDAVRHARFVRAYGDRHVCAGSAMRLTYFHSV